jgi:aspartyl-tRNA(Asn)/glutamyl-tRNA(Gln) amidotransferase subunit A
MLDVLAGYDPTTRASAKTAKVDYGAAAIVRSGAADRAGAQLVRGQGFRHAGDEGGIDEAVRVLKDLGATVEDVVFPGYLGLSLCGRVVITVEAHAIHRQEVIETAEKFGYTTRRRFQLGASSPPSSTSRAALPPPAHARHARGDARLRPGDGGQPLGRAGDLEEPQPIFHFLGKPSLTMPFNVTGQPAATICCGFAAKGYPLSFQLAGRAFDEASVLRRRCRLRTRHAVAHAPTKL